MWFDFLSRRSRPRPRSDYRKPTCCTLAVEALEDRTVPSFLAPVSYPTGGTPYTVVTADFNNDAIPDIAVLNSEGTVSVLLGKGDGTFQAARTSATGVAARGIVAADFNRDGKLDLATLNSGDPVEPSTHNLSVLLGNGDGTFGPAQTFDLPTVNGQRQYPDGFALGDLNGDGKPDLVVSGYATFSLGGNKHGWTFSYTENFVNTLLGKGDGTFRPKSTIQVNGGLALALGDFNRDGRLDVLTGPQLLLGNGDGTLQAPVVAAANGGSASLAVGDFNGDGKLDFLEAGGSGVVVYLGNGDGTFGPAQFFAVSGYQNAVTVGDVNHDGKLDIMMANSNGMVSVLLGNGDGTFQAQRDFAAGSAVLALAVADFNHDGFLDLAAVGGDLNGVSILLNDGHW
jgi:hypothetical protein